MKGWQVWDELPTAVCLQRTGKRPLGSRWVDVNKGDRTKPDVRSRLVAQEIAHHRNDDFYAATPPLEALRMLLSIAASTRGCKVFVMDARWAHLHATVDRLIYVDLPPEARKPGMCARLRLCPYGTRDAPAKLGGVPGSRAAQDGLRAGPLVALLLLPPGEGAPVRCARR